MHIIQCIEYNAYNTMHRIHQKFGLYAEVTKKNAWKIKTVKEIIDVRFGNLEVINFTPDELEEILNFVCSS